MSGPRDNYVGAPFLLFWGSEIIMVGPALSCEDPDLLCPGPKIIMWEPDYVGSPTCHVGTPRYGDPDLLCGGRDNYVWAPIYDVGAPTYHVGAPDIIWLSKYLIFFNHIHIWQVSLPLSFDDTFQMWELKCVMTTLKNWK